MMKRKTFSWGTLLLLALVGFSVQGCLGIGGSSTGKKVATSSNGQQVTVVQDSFKGKIYLTISQNLYVLSGNNTSQELVNTGNVYDPAVSPDGKWVAFIEKYKQYSNLCVVSTAGGKVRVLRSGNGKFYKIDEFLHDTYYWYAQPAWSPDGSTLLFLSDLEKEDWYAHTPDSPMLDLQVFSVPFNNPTATPKDVAYASFGDGGDRDVAYRPGHTNQIIYTHYAYDATTETEQEIQIFMENPATISNNPGVYYPGSPGAGYDPGIAITTDQYQDIEPAFSPDGNEIAYIKRQSTQMDLMVMPAPPDNITSTPNDTKTESQAVQQFKTASSRLLSTLYVDNPVWSPDGKQLAYTTYNGSEFDLWIANLTVNAKTGAYSIKGTPTQITTGGIDGVSRPVWTS